MEEKTKEGRDDISNGHNIQQQIMNAHEGNKHDQLLSHTYIILLLTQNGKRVSQFYPATDLYLKDLSAAFFNSLFSPYLQNGHCNQTIAFGIKCTLLWCIINFIFSISNDMLNIGLTKVCLIADTWQIP